MIKPKCIAFDFDKTLAGFIDNLDGLYRIFTERGVTREVIDEVLEDVILKGFNFSSFIDAIIEKTNLDLDYDALLTECDNWLYDMISPYEGAVEFIEKYSSNIPIAIVTFGEKEFQLQKIEAVGLDECEVHITEAIGTKASIIEELGEKYGYPVLFVDDKLKELDAVANKMGENAITAFFDRPDLRDNADEMEKCHIRLGTFEDIEKMLQK